jgi:hypothetical protein
MDGGTGIQNLELCPHHVFSLIFAFIQAVTTIHNSSNVNPTALGSAHSNCVVRQYSMELQLHCHCIIFAGAEE